MLEGLKCRERITAIYRREHNEEKDVGEERFDRTILVNPVFNEVHIPLEDMRNGSVARKLHLEAIGDSYFLSSYQK